jgi:peptidoglycan L-alanyl-D-glutamate endopeptidase CwlK
MDFEFRLETIWGAAMLIFIALLYFCLVCSIVWLVFFPSGRDLVVQFVAAMGRRVDRRVAGLQQMPGRHADALGRTVRKLAARLFKFVRRRYLACGGAVALILVPAVIALTMSSPAMLPGYEVPELPPDSRVADLLRGELLAPPVALPPLAFTTLEVELVRPMLVDASRNWSLLHPEFGQRLLLAFKIMKEKHGYDMALLEGYRSPARQDLLASMGNQVTNAGAFQSYHQYGLAADCAFWRDGRLIISEKDPWAMRGYQLYGEVAESLGLTWGGRWTMMDFGHAELRLKGALRK